MFINFTGTLACAKFKDFYFKTRPVRLLLSSLEESKCGWITSFVHKNCAKFRWHRVLIVRDFFYFVTWNLKWRRIPSFSSKSICHVVFFNFGGCVALWAMLCVEETSKMTYCVRVSGPFVQTKPNFLATDKNNGTTLLGSADTMRRSHYSSVSRVCASHFAYSTIAGCQVPIFSSFLTFLLFSPIFSKNSYFFLFWGSFT